MDARRVIEAIRARTPEHRCVPGCNDCCGPVFFARWEWERLPIKREPTGLDCPYASPQGCLVYDERPVTCRLYGVVDRPGWVCSQGGQAAALIPWPEAKQMIDDYHRVLES